MKKKSWVSTVKTWRFTESEEMKVMIGMEKAEK